MSSWSSSVTKSGYWSANFTVASSTGPATAPSWLPSAGCFPGNAGELSWSRQRPCFVGTEQLDGASGERGDGNEARDGQR